MIKRELICTAKNKFFVYVLTAISLFGFACERSGNDDSLKIVFISNRITTTDKYKVCVIEPDGENERVITKDSLDCYFPRFSPDGSRILFFTRKLGNAEIYSMKSDGSKLINLTKRTGEDIQPQFSPDGSKIVFVSDRDGNREIYIMNADGSGQTRLTNNNYIDYSPVFSPSGQQLLFYSMINRDSLYYDIFIINSDGSGLKKITQTGTFFRPYQMRDYDESAFDWTPRFSPDGKNIVFSAEVSAGFGPQIFMMDTGGNNIENLTNTPDHNVAPFFSPDGNRIFFRTHRDDRFQIYSMNTDGSDPVNVSNDMGHTYFCDFSDDGLRMVYYSNADAYYDIYLMDLQSNSKIKLTENSDTHDNLMPMFYHHSN